jgi:uncharacterized membrane protein YoaK (UPF0700 family)
MKRLSMPPLLSFNDGFGETAGFLGLQGLTAHETGNFVTLAALFGLAQVCRAVPVARSTFGAMFDTVGAGTLTW